MGALHLYCVEDAEDEYDPLQAWIKILKCSCRSRFVEKIPIREAQGMEEALVVFVARVSETESPEAQKFLKERLSASQMKTVQVIAIPNSEKEEVAQEALVIFTEKVDWDKASTMVSSLRETTLKSSS